MTTACPITAETSIELTEVEHNALQALGAGKTIPAAAKELFYSVDGFKAIIRRLLRKFGVSHLNQLVRRATETGFLTADCLPPRLQHLPVITLTEIERYVLNGVAAGKTNATIGQELGISAERTKCEDSIKQVIRHLLQKFGAQNRTHLVCCATHLGLL